MYSPIDYYRIALEITALCCSHAFDDIHVSSLSLNIYSIISILQIRDDSVTED